MRVEQVKGLNFVAHFSILIRIIFTTQRHNNAIKMDTQIHYNFVLFTNPFLIPVNSPPYPPLPSPPL